MFFYLLHFAPAAKIISKALTTGLCGCLIVKALPVIMVLLREAEV